MRRLFVFLSLFCFLASVSLAQEDLFAHGASWDVVGHFCYSVPHDLERIDGENPVYSTPSSYSGDAYAVGFTEQAANGVTDVNKYYKMFAICMSADHSPLQLISIDGRTAALFSYSDDSGNSAALLYYRSGAVLAGVITSSSISEEDLLSMMRTLSTRVSYDRLIRVYDDYDYEYAARWPDRYAGADVKLSGSVLQILKGSETYRIRVATSGSYDDVVYVVVPFGIMPEYRILEDDHVEISGMTCGEYSYESVSGSTITLPHVIAETISVPGI